MEPMTSQENDGLIRKAYIRGCALQSDPNPPLSFLSKLITLSCYIPCGNHTKQRKEKKKTYIPTLQTFGLTPCPVIQLILQQWLWIKSWASNGQCKKKKFLN